MRRPVWVLAAVGLVGVLGAVLAVQGGADGPPAPSPVAAFHAQLDAHGFVVQDGLTPTVSPIELVDAHIIDSANGNNAGQPYKGVVVPPYPASGQRPGTPFVTFQLRPDEAVVYVGPTPPRVDYFSFTPFLQARYLHSTIPKGDWLA